MNVFSAKIVKSKLGVNGFSLIELLVALAVFATMAALAYGGLNSVARTRTNLVREQDDFRGLVRAVTLLERDLREIAARPVRANSGAQLAALTGSVSELEFTRFGFANPQIEPRSNLERVLYELDANTLKRGSYPVLDRAPDTVPQISTLRDKVNGFRLRYLDIQNHWFDAWPPANTADPASLPRAVEFNIDTKEYGEITRVVALPSTPPLQAAGALSAPSTPTPVTAPTTPPSGHSL